MRGTARPPRRGCSKVARPERPGGRRSRQEFASSDELPDPTRDSSRCAPRMSAPAGSASSGPSATPGTSLRVQAPGGIEPEAGLVQKPNASTSWRARIRARLARKQRPHSQTAGIAIARERGGKMSSAQSGDHSIERARHVTGYSELVGPLSQPQRGKDPTEHRGLENENLDDRPFFALEQGVRGSGLCQRLVRSNLARHQPAQSSQRRGRLGLGPLPIGIDADLHLCSNGAANREQAPSVLVQRATGDLYLQDLVTGIDRLDRLLREIVRIATGQQGVYLDPEVGGAAQQPRQGHAARLCDEIEQAELQPKPRRRRRAPIADLREELLDALHGLWNRLAREARLGFLEFGETVSH